MVLKEEKDFITGIYRCKDDIKNLKLRVRLDCVRSSDIPHESDVSSSATGRGATASSTGQTVENSNSLEEVEIAWQQRILSAEEVARYSVLKNCVSQREQQWHREIESSQHSASQKIFTYTEADQFVPENERDIFCHGEKLASHLESNQRSVRQVLLEKPSRTRVLGLSGPGLGKESIVDENPSKETRLMNRTLSCPLQLMYVFAQLSNDPNNESSLAAPTGVTNYHLATLSWDPDRRALTITPDLNTSPADTYKLDMVRAVGSRGGQVEWRYCILPLQSTGLTRELLTEELIWRKPVAISLEGAFQFPRQGVHDVFVSGEIVCGRHFEYNHLFVQYFVHLPHGWSCEEPSSLYGVTQRCRYANKTRVAHFSFPFEFKLSLNLACLETEDSETRGQPQSPQLLFEIGSLDSWGRYRNEGYAWAALPRTPGRRTLHLTSVRPAARGPVDELCRAFIGSSLQISDLTYVGKPADATQKQTLSKLGFSTEPSGTLAVTLNIAHQSHVTQDLGRSRNSSVYLLERLSANTLLSNVNHVIEAFQRARQRMLLVCQPLLSSEGKDRGPDR